MGVYLCLFHRLMNTESNPLLQKRVYFFNVQAVT